MHEAGNLVLKVSGVEREVRLGVKFLDGITMSGWCRAFPLGRGADPLTFSFPMIVGLGPETYNGEDYGYFSAGVNAAVPLAFVPLCYGTWTATVGFAY